MTNRINIRFLAMFKEIAGKSEIIYEAPAESTLREILMMLGRKYGHDFEDTIDKQTGQVDFNTLVMINGHNIRDPDVKLKDRDLVIITVPVSGG